VFVKTPTGEQLLGITAAGDATCMTRATDARVDTAVSDFILPYLQSPPVIGSPTIELADTCTATCSQRSECPAGMACQGGQCQLAGALPASYHATCASDAECGDGMSARVTPDECRCAVACISGPGPGGEDQEECNASGRTSWLALLAVALSGYTSRRRRRA
jgi:hypothetical protein